MKVDLMKTVKQQNIIRMTQQSTAIFISDKHEFKQNQIQFQDISISQCLICMENREETAFYSFGCQHKFCQSCLLQYIQQKLKEYQLIKCCYQNCGYIMDKSSSSLYHQLSNDYKKKVDVILDNYDRITKVRQCQYCHQGNLIQKINQNSKQILACSKCSQISCYNCFYPLHKGSCTSHERLDFPPGCGQCRRCLNIILKNQGCNHVKCICGYQFCFECGFHWDPSHICEYKLQKRTGISKYLCNFVKIILAIPLLIFIVIFFLFYIILVSFLSGLVFSLLGWISILDSKQKNQRVSNEGTNLQLTQGSKPNKINKQNNTSFIDCVLLIFWLLLMPIGCLCLFVAGLSVPIINICWKKKVVFETDLISSFGETIGHCIDVYLII